MNIQSSKMFKLLVRVAQPVVRAAPSVPQPLGEAPRGGHRAGGSPDPPAAALTRWRRE